MGTNSIDTLKDMLCRINMEAANVEELYGLSLGSFLDKIYKLPIHFIKQAIEDEPIWNENIEPAYYAYTAAVAHTFSSRYELFSPMRDNIWFYNSKYFLKEPWFPQYTEGLKDTLIAESPREFRIRNMFVSKNALNRA